LAAAAKAAEVAIQVPAGARVAAPAAAAVRVAPAARPPIDHERGRQLCFATFP
jgi:hypothetical protein